MLVLYKKEKIVRILIDIKIEKENDFWNGLKA